MSADLRINPFQKTIEIIAVFQMSLFYQAADSYCNNLAIIAIIEIQYFIASRPW
jgi:hypothetical protein